MLALLILFFTSMVVAFSGAMMPGPLLTVTISESGSRGAMAGPVLIFGHAILEMLLVLGLLFGLGPFLKNEIFFLVIALLGGAIMFWMAYGMFKSLPTLSVQTSGNSSKKNNLFLAGALMSLANPYWIIWWATIGIAYIVQAQKFGVWGIVLFYLGHITGDLIWYSAISVAISKGKKIFTDRIYRILIAVCGSFLVAFAFYLMVVAIGKMI
ncbi:MAG: LysE family transporter [Prolixibacteraceae bacterium]